MSDTKNPGVLDDLRDSAAAFWGERNERERRILIAGAVAVVVGICYALLFNPALKGRKQLNGELPELRQQSAEMQSLAGQAAQLKNAASAATDPVSQESVAGSLGTRGLKPKSISVSDGFVRLQLDGVSFAGLADWLDEQQKSTHLVVIEANFVPQKQIDTVNATLTLKQQRPEG
ncbi:MAG TPA: type II secretion system protein M [Burkholderiaceae bacterium]